VPLRKAGYTASTIIRKRDGAEHHLPFFQCRIRTALNSRYIDNVQITVAEDMGIEQRCFYEQTEW
jgi:hypothetical protein